MYGMLDVKTTDMFHGLFANGNTLDLNLYLSFYAEQYRHDSTRLVDIICHEKADAILTTMTLSRRYSALVEQLTNGVKWLWTCAFSHTQSSNLLCLY